jgi:hypothetical protein
MERQISEILQRIGTSIGGDHPQAKVAAQNLGDFKIQEVRSMQRLARSKDTAAYTRCLRSL